jgi:hypothetical protein
MFYQRRITEVVPQDGDPMKVLICHSGNLGLLVDISWGIEIGDIVTFETAGNSPIGMISKVVGVMNYAGVAKPAAAEAKNDQTEKPISLVSD